MGKKKVLIIGNSHIECIIDAYNEIDTLSLSFINLRPIGKCSNQKELQKIINLVPDERIDVLIVCIRGNLHNGWGLYEQTSPICLGNMSGISSDDLLKRDFIPYSVMYENMEHHYDFPIMQQLFDHFKDAEKFYLIPPPPVNILSSEKLDLSSCIGRVQQAFSLREHLGTSSNSLRKALYDIEVDVLTNNMDKFGISLMSVPSEVLNETGFLDNNFFDKSDPIHGNIKYGQMLLNRITKNLDG